MGSEMCIRDSTIDIDKMTIIDSGGDGQALPGIAKQLPASVIAIAEQIETATGVDIMGPLRDRMGGSIDPKSNDSTPALGTSSASEAPQINVSSDSAVEATPPAPSADPQPPAPQANS